MSFTDTPEYAPPPYSSEPPAFPSVSFPESDTSQTVNFPSVLPPPEFPSLSNDFPAVPPPPAFPSLYSYQSELTTDTTFQGSSIPSDPPVYSLPEPSPAAAVVASRESVLVQVNDSFSSRQLPEAPTPPGNFETGNYAQYYAATSPANLQTAITAAVSPGVTFDVTVTSSSTYRSPSPRSFPAQTHSLLEGNESVRVDAAGPYGGLVTGRQDSIWSHGNSGWSCVYEAWENKCVRFIISAVVCGIILIIILSIRNSMRSSNSYSYKSSYSSSGSYGYSGSYGSSGSYDSSGYGSDRSRNYNFGHNSGSGYQDYLDSGSRSYSRNGSSSNLYKKVKSAEEILKRYDHCIVY